MRQKSLWRNKGGKRVDEVKVTHRYACHIVGLTKETGRDRAANAKGVLKIIKVGPVVVRCDGALGDNLFYVPVKS